MLLPSYYTWQSNKTVTVIVKHIKPPIFFFGSLILVFGLQGCKSLEGTKIAQIYHNITAKYNGYFNAREIMRDMVETNNDQFPDDYNEILPIYRFPPKEMAKGNASKSDKIVEKCTRVIQKHEPSKWTDDCYLLMGKAYFYKGDYISAKQRFRYVKNKYKGNNEAYRASLWIVRTYLKQDDVNQARAMVTSIKSNDDFPEVEELKKMLNLTEASVAIQSNQFTTAAKKIKEAQPKINNRDLRTRLHFILGQLYQEQKNYSKAIFEYNKVLSNRPVYETAFHAKINKASCFQEKGGRDISKVREDLKRMLKDDKNVDYKSRIYYELAQLAKKNNNKEAFINYLNKALEAKQATPEQKATAYQHLAQYHFKKGNYDKAKTYFDNTFSLITPEYDGYEQLKNKKAVLDDLVSNKKTLTHQDSLQAMRTWDKKQFRSQFKKIIKAEKQKAKRKKQQQKQQQQLEQLKRNQQQRLAQNKQQDLMSNQNSGTWYFYNESAKSKGEPAFQRQWGDRPLRDNWRTETEKSSNFEGEEQKEQPKKKEKPTQAKKGKESLNERYKAIPENYKQLPDQEKQFYAKIPFDSTKLATSNKAMKKALFNTGLIYYQDLQDINKSRKYFNKLNNKYPGSRYEPKAYYYLYKLNIEQGEKAKAEKYKRKLATKYPKSKYTTLIQNPEKLRQKAQKDNPELEKYYKNTYQYYQNSNCKKVRVRKNKADSIFEANYLKHKFQYLKILCEGKNQDTKKTFKQKLKQFIEANPNKKQTINHAQNVYNFLVTNKEKKVASKSENKDFPFNQKAEKPHLYFIVVSLKDYNTQKIKQRFSDYNNEYYKFLNLNISALMYGETKRMILIRDFKNKTQALNYLESVANDDDFIKKLGINAPNHFVANIDNYKRVIKNNKLPLYEEFFKQEYMKANR